MSGQVSPVFIFPLYQDQKVIKVERFHLESQHEFSQVIKCFSHVLYFLTASVRVFSFHAFSTPEFSIANIYQNINKNSPGFFRIHVRSWKDLYLGRSTKLETARYPGPGHRGSSSLGLGDEFRGAPHRAGDLQRIHPGRLADVPN